MSDSAKSVLIIVFDGVEEIEALAPADIFRRAGLAVTLAAVGGEPSVRGRNGIVFLPDAAFSEVDANAFDLVFLPGGPGVLELEGNTQILELLKGRHQAKAFTAAICAAPKILATAGVLDDLTATSHQSVRETLPNASSRSVVIDGHIATSQGAGTAIEFALELTSRLASDEVAQNVRESIHA